MFKIKKSRMKYRYMIMNSSAQAMGSESVSDWIYDYYRESNYESLISLMK